MGKKKLPHASEPRAKLQEDRSSSIPDLALCIYPSCCSLVSFIVFFSKLIKVSVVLSSVSHSRKLIEPKEKVVRTSNL